MTPQQKVARYYREAHDWKRAAETHLETIQVLSERLAKALADREKADRLAQAARAIINEIDVPYTSIGDLNIEALREALQAWGA